MKVGLVYRNVAVTPSGLGGGGDVFIVYLLRAMRELGHYTVFATVRPTDWKLVERALGWVTRPDEERGLTILPDVGGLRLLRNMLPAPLVSRLKKDCDVTFDAYGMNILWDMDFVYLHTPPTREELEERYQRAWYRKLYYDLFSYLHRRRLKRSRTRVITNSEYSRQSIKEVFGLDSKVLYPPVDTKLYSRLLKQDRRKDIVLTIGRYTWERRLDLIPEMAVRVPRAEFHIIGNTVLGFAWDVIKQVRLRAESLNVSNRVHLHVDIPLEEKLELMSKAKVYINMLREEHFGIAIAEAMSAGMIPVVPNEGGQREIVGRREFMFEDLEEAASLVELWLSGWNPSFAHEISSIAERFSYERFKDEIEELLSAF